MYELVVPSECKICGSKLYRTYEYSQNEYFCPKSKIPNFGSHYRFNTNSYYEQALFCDEISLYNIVMNYPSSTFCWVGADGYSTPITKNFPFLLNPTEFKSLTKDQLLSKIKMYNLWS